MQRKMLAMDLFAGCGGMSLGMQRAGFEVVYANEMNKDAASTYSKNFPNVHLQVSDIQDVRPQDVDRILRRSKIDIIGAGPPCQGFSTLVKRNGHDPRNRLFRNLVKFLDYFQPRAFVMENVSGLLSMSKGKTIKKIQDELESTGYVVRIRKLLASDFGVPQVRPRVFLIGVRDEIPEDDLFPDATCTMPISAREAMSDLEFLGIGDSATSYKLKPESTYQKAMKGGNKILHNHESPNHSDRIQRRFKRIPCGSDAKKLSHYDSRKRDCYKLDPSLPCKTVTTLPEDFIHYKRNRIPTVRELARIQSFPDDFEFLGPRTSGGSARKHACPQYTQVGNAVPPLLAESVFKNLRKIIMRHNY